MNVQAVTMCAIGLGLAAVDVAAEKIDAHPPTAPYTARGACPDLGGGGYKFFLSTTCFPAGCDIPDAGGPADPLVVTATTIPDGNCLTDVFFEIDIAHTWAGDLIIDIAYDEDNDGTPEASTTVLDRVGGNCDLDGVYAFHGAGDDIDAACPAAPLGPGCYSSATMDMSVFEGLPKGGTFSVTISDNASADVGVLRSMAVYSANMLCAVPTYESSWSEIKSTF